MGTMASPEHPMDENLGTYSKAVDQKKRFSDIVESDEQPKLTARNDGPPLVVTPQQTVTEDGQTTSTVSLQPPLEPEVVIEGSSETAFSSPQQPNPPADDTARNARLMKRVLQCFITCIAKFKPNPSAENVDITATLKSTTTVSKILIGVALTGITTIIASQLTPILYGSQVYEWMTVVVLLAQNVAILMMILGIYLQARHPKISKWLQSFGHLLCLEALIVLQALFMKMPLRFIPFPLVVVAVALLGTIACCQ